jgi:hypothetical protein
MYLTSRHSIKTDHDIVCYNVFYDKKTIYPEEIIQGDEIVNIKDDVEFVPVRFLKGVFNIGGILECFPKYSDAEGYLMRALMYSELEPYRLKLFECIIPKGSYYYKGVYMYPGNTTCFGVKKVKIIKNVFNIT